MILNLLQSIIIGKKLKRKEFVPAIVVVENEDKYLIVNGHHRYYAHLVAGEKTIKAIVIEGTFEDTEPLRKAEVLLKEYDKKNQYQYQFSGYLDRWAAEAEDARFVNKYRPIIKVDLFSGLKVFLKKVYGKNS